MHGGPPPPPPPMQNRTGPWAVSFCGGVLRYERSWDFLEKNRTMWLCICDPSALIPRRCLWEQVGGISVDRGGHGERQVVLSCEAAGAKIANISFAAYGYDDAPCCPLCALT